MESIINHDECFGFDASFGMCFLGDYTFCIRTGNFLQINRFKDRAIDQLGMINGELTGFSSMAGDPLNHILAYADRIKNPQIHFTDINSNETGLLTIHDVVGIKSMKFSYDGQWLYALGGLPSFRLSAINMKEKKEAYSQVFNHPIGENISVCPTKPRLFAIFGDSPFNFPRLPFGLHEDGPKHLIFFTLLGTSSHYSFSKIVSVVPDPVISICWSPQEKCIIGTSTGKIYFIDPLTGEEIRDSFSLEYLGEGKQNATALLCTYKYLIVSGSTGNLYWIELNDIENKENLFILDTRAPLVFMQILPGTNSLLFANSHNVLSSIDLDPESQQFMEDSWINLRDAHKGPITCATAIHNHLITVGEDGTMRFWAYSPYLNLSQSFSFGNDGLTVVTSSKGGSLIAVGSKSGILRIINTSDPQQPILLYREKLHKAPISSITISADFIVSGSNDGSVAIMRCDPKNCFPLIGLLKLQTSIISVAIPPPLGSIPQLLIATNHKEVLRIDIPNTPPDNFKITIETTNRAILKVSNKIMAICAESSLREDQQYFYCACDDKTIKYYCMPLSTADLDIVGDDVEPSAPDDVFVGHAKSASAVALSTNQQYVASGCAGSLLIVREVDVATAQTKDTLLNMTNHDPLYGSITSITFSPDDRKLFTVGFDGCINMYTLKISNTMIPTDPFEMPQGCFKISVSHVFGIDQQINNLSEVWNQREYDINEEDGFQADNGPGSDEIALIDQIKIEERKQHKIESEAFHEELLDELNKIKTEFMRLVDDNEKASELERLNKNDFTLDIQTAEKLQQIAEVKAKLVYYRRKIKCQIRNLIAQSISDKCYVPFEPKLLSIYAFQMPISFDNFPLPVKNEKMIRHYKCISLLRRTEIAALRYKNSPNDPNGLPISPMKDGSLDGSRYLSSRSNSLVQLTATETENEILVKDDLSLLYDPFQIVTANRKITQLLVVQNLVYEELNKFNLTFEDLLIKKQNLVQSLEEKNKRIRQLIRILKLNENDYVIFDPVAQPNEATESFLDVRDDEIILKKQIDTQEKDHEDADDLEKDSFAERALRKMMGGNVTMNSMEEAPADDEPVRPEWMTTKKKEELTEEEQYQIQEFEKKLKNFIEEREKRRKALNAELTKLVKGNASSIDEFDRSICQTYMIRFDCEEKVYYHELEIMHLVESLIDERNAKMRLNNISEESIKISSEQRQKQPFMTEISTISARLNEEATAADQNLENLKSQVNKEFHNRECINQLLRLYNSVAKRVKPQVENCPNPFRQYISQPYVFKDDLTDVMNNRPSSLADGPWKNFIEYCERKVQFSRDVAEKANIANEMKLRLRDFENEMNRIEDSLREIKDDKSILTDELLNALVDMHIPFTFRQGQVEIPSDIVLINYDDVVLIDKKVVIDRNKLILEAGQKKLDELENIKKQHTNHRMLKWEIDKSRVDLTNLEEQFKEYQLFRVKKEDMLLIQGGERNKNQDLVNQLNKGLDHMQRTHAIRLARAKQDLKKLKRKVNLKKKENDKIEDDILKMQLELKERKRIYNIQMISSKGAAEARKNRLKQVMMISKLKRAKQIQDEKITILNDEIIKLRKCVYTTFNDGEDIGGMVGYA